MKTAERTFERRCLLAGFLGLAAIGLVAQASETTGSGGQGEATAGRIPLGGATTIDDASSQAFSFPAPNLSPEALEQHLEGDFDFETPFVTAPAEHQAGLGPKFNNTSCINCHVNDGRGRPDKIGTPLSSLLLRVSLPGKNPETGGPKPVPGIGTQLADRAVYGEEPDGQFRIAYEPVGVTYPDGAEVELRRPRYIIEGTREPLPPETLISPRVAPPVFGRGLLEAIPVEELEKLADPEDQDGDGISGKLNRVYDPAAKEMRPGRFGHKAGQATMLAQSASAYLDDMGISSPLKPGDYEQPEVDWETLEDVTFYSQTLAVPRQRNADDPIVLKGEKLFAELNCVACHQPEFETGELEGVPSVSGQEIRPYTDLLLHDMGEGLADHRPEYDADGYEWRTPPLWGVGLTRVVGGHTFFLHDGRARNLEEAILWHGGEAEASKDAFMNLPVEDRDALLQFLESL